ncbi:hypothetical protein H6H00_16405 [Pseudonocardia petroleophila]|uniref:Inner membrane component domain-containing protein n=1 Tax=Pseudonocardia petroleophila TaxID=37331 RepID=A0A7G7MAR3_9PSEU|nr:hypothetical protein H6H00_16405 [Pseudonocardia petroleophila]
MRTLGNVLWFLLAGWWPAILHAVAGVIACVLVVTIPFGIASFRLAGYALWPFGRRVEVHRGAGLALVPLGTRVVDADRADVPGYRVAA